jgi:hypothetical protein
MVETIGPCSAKIILAVCSCHRSDATCAESETELVSTGFARACTHKCAPAQMYSWNPSQSLMAITVRGID